MEYEIDLNKRFSLGEWRVLSYSNEKEGKRTDEKVTERPDIFRTLPGSEEGCLIRVLACHRLAKGLLQ